MVRLLIHIGDYMEEATFLGKETPMTQYTIYEVDTTKICLRQKITGMSLFHVLA